MEAKIAGNKAPMCYGYLKLDEHDENFLDRKFLVYSWDRPAQNEIYLDPADFKPLGPVGAGDLHLHAIVLEFIDGTTLDKANASIASVAPGLREQLKEFHDAGVCFFDIKPDSIMLVSSTGKHCWLDFSIASTRIGPEDQNADRCQLENAIEKWCKVRLMEGDTTLAIWLITCSYGTNLPALGLLTFQSHSVFQKCSTLMPHGLVRTCLTTQKYPWMRQPSLEAYIMAAWAEQDLRKE